VKALIKGKWEEIWAVHSWRGNLFAENVMIVKGFDLVKHAKEQTVVLHKNNEADLLATIYGRFQLMKFKSIVNTAYSVTPENWHERLAHVNTGSLKNTEQKGAAFGFENFKFRSMVCTPCIKAKSKAQSNETSENKQKY